MTLDLIPNEVLLELFEHLIFYSSYKYVSTLKFVCKRWCFIAQCAIRYTINKRLKVDLQLEMRSSKSSKISNMYNVNSSLYIGIYNRSFSSQNEYFFLLSSTTIIEDQPKYIQIGLYSKRSIQLNNVKLPFNKPPKRGEDDFDDHWKVYITKASNKRGYYRSDLKFHELWVDDELAVGWQDGLKEKGLVINFFYLRIDLRKLMWFIDDWDYRKSSKIFSD